MSLRAILDVVVHLDSFRNIDLFFQGLYYVKVSLYNKKNEEVSEHNLIKGILAVLCKSILHVYVEDVRGKAEEDEDAESYRSS